MSEYFRSLEDDAKLRYVAKLEAVGLTIQDDPFSPENESRFVDDMAIWPRVEYGHIFTYFISRPGVYTQEQLLSWKQLESYNYFLNGYVRTIKAMKFGG